MGGLGLGIRFEGWIQYPRLRVAVRESDLRVVLSAVMGRCMGIRRETRRDVAQRVPGGDEDVSRRKDSAHTRTQRWSSSNAFWRMKCGKKA